MTAGGRYYPTSDNDRCDRTPLRIDGSYMPDGGTEHLCSTKNFSPLMLWLETEHKPELNEHVALFLERVGRIEGWVVRVTPTGFAIVMQVTGDERQRVETRLRRLSRLRPNNDVDPETAVGPVPRSVGLSARRS